jgi:hypothetical protein
MADYPETVKYQAFRRRHPSYDEKKWSICRALYAGGDKLLTNDDVMKEIFPRHSVEPEEIYQERKRRAYYIPYAGEIIDAIVASLTSAPVSMTAEPELSGAVDVDFYQSFYEDVSKPGGKKISLNQLLRDQILVALQCRTAWTLVDLPSADERMDDVVMGYASLADQLAAGALDAYACPIAPENVCDWEEDDSGELEWVLLRAVEKKRRGLDSDRNKVHETWTFYDRDGWARYKVEYEEKNPPADDADVTIDAKGEHSFGRVPIARLELPEGLAAMQKIQSIAIAHFNKRNALTWAELKSLFPVPVAYLQAADPLAPATHDDTRAMQPHAVNRMRVMAEKDRLEYFSPDTGPFQFTAEDLNNLRDEMHRVLHHMALSVDNSGAALQRSADSKAIDQAVAAVVLGALGAYVREHAIDLYKLVQVGRDEDEEREWAAIGMDDFDDTTAGALIEQALNLEAVQIPSATFQVEYRFGIAKRLLGAKTPQETLIKVREELEGNLTQETFDIAKETERAELDATKRQMESAPDDPDGEAHKHQLELEKAKASAKGAKKGGK